MVTFWNSLGVLPYALLAGVLYASLIKWIRREVPDHHLTAVMVVFGNLIVLFLFGWEYGEALAMRLFFIMAAAGAPMVAEYYLHVIYRQRRKVKKREGLKLG